MQSEHEPSGPGNAARSQLTIRGFARRWRQALTEASDAEARYRVSSTHGASRQEASAEAFDAFAGGNASAGAADRHQRLTAKEQANANPQLSAYTHSIDPMTEVDRVLLRDYLSRTAAVTAQPSTLRTKAFWGLMALGFAILLI